MSVVLRSSVLSRILVHQNRPFPSSLVPLFQSESKYETILIKKTFICMKKKLRAELIFIWKVSHLDSVWKRGTRELGNGLLIGGVMISTCARLPIERSKFQPCPRTLCRVLRQDTLLSQCLSAQVYKWAPAKLNAGAEVTLRWSRVEILSRFMLQTLG